MQLSDDVISILANFSSINQSIQFKESNIIRTISPTKTVMAKATLQDKFDSTFCIYSLSRFLGVLSMFDEKPELEVNDGFMTIKSTNRSVNYTFAEPEVLVLPPNKDINIVDCDINFNLKNDDLQEVIKVRGVMSLPDLVVVGENGKIILRVTDVKNKDADNYDILIGTTSSEFKAVIKVENLKLIKQDYDVLINPKGIAYFKGDSVEYWIALEDSSDF